jgi:hypothetical protein
MSGFYFHRKAANISLGSDVLTRALSLYAKALGGSNG